jgi:hypothetical protein
MSPGSYLSSTHKMMHNLSNENEICTSSRGNIAICLSHRIAKQIQKFVVFLAGRQTKDRSPWSLLGAARTTCRFEEFSSVNIDLFFLFHFGWSHIGFASPVTVRLLPHASTLLGVSPQHVILLQRYGHYIDDALFGSSTRPLRAL